LNVAVIQVSRKRETSESAGKDVTSEHLGNLLALREETPGSALKRSAREQRHLTLQPAFTIPQAARTRASK